MLMLWTLFAIFVTGNQFLIKGICSNMTLTTNLRVKIPPILITYLKQTPFLYYCR